METPAGRSRGHATPASGRKSALKTPKSVLTPNDDAAEKASIRRKRRSEALRLSLSDAFAGQADQHGRQQPGNSNASTGHAARHMLSEEARSALLEQCLKLATENKITDRNAWHLDLISHLPDIVGSGSAGNRSSGYNFQKMSGGLDAGVTIYSKRVDLTYKEAFQSLRGCGPNKQDDGDDDEAGCEDDGDEGIEDAAAAAAKAQKNKGRNKQQGEAADEENTLTTPEHLRQKKGDTTFAVDPLFHTMSALFDEGGAKGLLLLNRSVFNGAHIMTAPHDVPEQQFSLQSAPQQDTLLDLRPLQQQLAACSHASCTTHGTAGAAASAGPVLTPGLDQLYSLLEQTRKSLPMTKQQQQQDQQCNNVDVASIMQLATRNLPPTPMPRAFRHTSGPSSHAAGAAGGAFDQPNTSSASTGPLSPDMAAAGADADMADADLPDDSGCRDDAHEGPVAGGLPVVASFLASCAAAEEEDEAAAGAGGAAADQDDSYGGGGFGGPEGAYGDDEGCDHPGYGDDGDSSWGQQQQQKEEGDAGRRLSMLGLGGDQGADDGSVLDAEALQQLLGGAAGAGRKGSTMTGSGWAGSKYWKYRSAAAAAARMASGRGDAVKRASAAAHGGRSRSAAAFRIDFTNPPEGLSAALAPGSRRQTCLVTAPSSTTADTLLPEDLHYQASSLLRLFLRSTPISFARQQQQGGRAPGGGEQLHSWDEEAADDGGWGGDGYDDDGADDMGAEGYNAGDLSMGDPGFSHSHMGHAESSGAEWWSPDGELLSAPKRTTGRGVSYHRSAKQVDVRALKDLLWDSLVTVNQQHSSSTPDNTAAAAASTSEASEAGGLPVIPFQEVIVHVPDDSPAGALQDVSVHMCFICLLHLANEKGLVVRAQEDLKTLTISNVQEQEQGGAEVH